ncbi:D-lactate dehydrogenase [Weissella ceti]|uniref:Quinone-dependent D-lactate dehydrogenase n=1 Tax=Weissella ceti TaxID=759620 RepID=A0ABT3E353_9LACO|nr:D-lactate dehydrogenase [Weissella ceti]MCW0952827.1 D-lactate dehydrogenase [Weissella ceti]QVK12524.1 D-lactate dehydrogenase [Weissella ceti]
MSVLSELSAVVGKKHVISNEAKSLRYRKGYRSGKGPALAVVQPGTMMELWQVLQILHKNNIVIIMQAANTSLTEGSVPTTGYDREVVVVNGIRIAGVQLINEGHQVLAFPGTTLFALENELKPLEREPHSVIGSSTLGATVIGGINNNSGGALVNRGPAYTELALYARINEDDELTLVNHLGIELGDTPEEIITNLENRAFDIDAVPASEHAAHNKSYRERVRDVDADSPASYNADPNQLYEVSGASGHVAAFAVRLDTFEKEPESKMFYIGTNNTLVLEEIRRQALSEFKTMPVSGEYMHRDAYDIAKKYGKDSLVVIDKLGTDFLPFLFGMKADAERMLDHIPFFKPYFPDRLMQKMSYVLPNQLPAKMEDYRNKYEHHLQLKMSGAGIEEAREYLTALFQEAEGDFFECTPAEEKKASLHRFVAAGAAIRFEEVHQDEVDDILALDIALRRNDHNWFEVLPEEIDKQIEHKLYYGHFLSHVMHQDYIVKKGVDAKKLKEQMLEILDQRGAIYPAEHNVGHMYHAAPTLVAHYKKNDPTNSFNPGVGKTTMHKYWQEF